MVVELVINQGNMYPTGRFQDLSPQDYFWFIYNRPIGPPERKGLTPGNIFWRYPTETSQ